MATFNWSDRGRGHKFLTMCGFPSSVAMVLRLTENSGRPVLLKSLANIGPKLTSYDVCCTQMAEMAVISLINTECDGKMTEIQRVGWA